MRTEYQHLRFVAVPRATRRKCWTCQNITQGDTLGLVSWDGGWMQYVYRPAWPAIYSAGCLADITDFIRQAMAEHRRTRKPGRQSELPAA